MGVLNVRIEESQVVIENLNDVEAVLVKGALVLKAPDGLSITLPPRLMGTAAASPPQPTEPPPSMPTPEPRSVEFEDNVEEPVVTTKTMLTPGLPLYEYLRLILKEAGKPMSLDDLYSRLRKRTAYVSNSPHLRNSVRTAMGRKRRDVIRQVSRTHWGLREWAHSSGDAADGSGQLAE